MSLTLNVPDAECPWRCVSLALGVVELGDGARGRPGALPSISPSGPRSLKARTQSRTVRRPTSAMRAASAREPPS